MFGRLLVFSFYKQILFENLYSSRLFDDKESANSAFEDSEVEVE